MFGRATIALGIGPHSSLFHILLHVCMSVDFASVKVVIKESYYNYYYYSTNQRCQYTYVILPLTPHALR